MYLLARFCLQLAIGCILYCVLMFMLLSWPYSIVCLLIIAAAARRKSRRQPTTLGSARFADESELRAAGMIGGDRGLILGHILVGPKKRLSVARLFSPFCSSQEACGQLATVFTRRRVELVRLRNAVHTAVFIPTGGGKSSGFVAQSLYDCDESTVCVDPTGQMATLTAEYRAKEFGHEVRICDPFGVITSNSDSLNPIDFIKADSRFALDECIELANSLVVREPGAKEPHWDDSAELWIAAVIAVVVRYGEENGLRSIQTVRDIFSKSESLSMAIRSMRESTAWEGMLARMGGQLEHFVDRELASTLTTVSRHMRIFDSPAIAATTRKSSFDPDRLNNGKMTVYLILPPDKLKSHGRLLRMQIGSLMRAVVRRGVDLRRRVHFILDEAASLGQMDAIDDALDKYRNFGIRMQMYYQSIGQLKTCFKEGKDLALFSNTSQVFAATNDHQTAELISSRLGEYTAIVSSGGSSEGETFQYSNGVQANSSRSWSLNTNSGWTQQARKLLKPEEVVALPQNLAITFTPGMRPIWTKVIKYFESPQTRKRPSRRKSWWEASKTLLMAFVIFLFSFTVAAIITYSV